MRKSVVKTTDLTMEVQPVSVDDKERGTIPATFSTWLMDIVKGSFGMLSMAALESHEDSGFEQTFLEVLALAEAGSLDLEAYYNGDRAMTEFKIKCYRRSDRAWHYVGMYTPDFLIVKGQDGEIHKAIIVETKGATYVNDPTFQDKCSFMESEFLRQNNSAFGCGRFEYLCLKDSFTEADRIRPTHDKICGFLED